MRVHLPVATVALVLLPRIAQGQAAPASDAFRASESEASKNLVAAADEMPADKYGVPLFKRPRAAVMTSAVADWADHYSQFAIYLRLNGLLPPTAQKR